MGDLPPDLERLGDALTNATSGEVAARRHRWIMSRRFAACLAAGVLVFAFTAPSRLVSSDSVTQRFPVAFVGAAVARADVLLGPCDVPHGGNGRYFQAPSGCQITLPPPQAR